MVIFDTNVIYELDEAVKEFYLNIDNYIELELLADRFSRTSYSFELTPERGHHIETRF